MTSHLLSFLHGDPTSLAVLIDSRFSDYALNMIAIPNSITEPFED